MSLLKKIQQRSVERKFSGTHPVLRMGLDRNVIDAYFTGLVFAAVADDENIDDAERQRLEKIGLAMNISDEDVTSMMSDMQSRDSDAKIAVAEECANALKESQVVQLFICEWTQVWVSHAYKQDELEGFRVQLCEWLGAKVDRQFYDSFDAVATGLDVDEECLQRVMGKISKDDLLYLFPERVDDIERIENARKAREQAKQRALEEERLKERKRVDAEKALREVYEFLLKFADECISQYKGRLTKAIFSQIKTDFGKAKLPAFDNQALFREIGQQLVTRIEALKLPHDEHELGLRIYRRRPYERTDDFLKAIHISQQTVWLLIALSSQKVEADGLSYKTIGELQSRAKSCDCWRAHDLSWLWHMGGLSDDSCETVFCPLLGVKPVWTSLSFGITDVQREKIRAWKNSRRRYNQGQLRKYADEIGVSPYCDGDVLCSL